MTTKASLRFFSTMAILCCLVFQHEVKSQSAVTVTGSVGRSDIEVNGLGILDVADPYIKPITQYTVGLQYAKGISRNVSLVTGAQYSSRGFGAREEFKFNVFGLDLPVGASVETRLDYLEVPLMMKFQFTESGVTPYIQAGASAGYAINGKITPKLNALVNWNLPSININLENEMYNRFDVSAIAGAGIIIPTNDVGSLQFEVNYRHSLNDMFLDNITDIRIKTHGISAGIGYSIRF